MHQSKELHLVIGLGPTGLSCVRHLVAQGKNVAVIDSREKPPKLDEVRALYPKVVCKVGGFDEKLLNAATHLVISPGVSQHEPAIQAQLSLGKPIMGDIELFVRQIDKPIIAITGSNGKSTVTSLVGEMAKQSGINVKVGGNIGIPVLQMLEGPLPDLFVLELSSFQLEMTSSLAARCAVNLNVSEDHMDRYASFEDYVQAKLRIYKNCVAAVVNLDDPISYKGVDLPEDWVGFSVAGADPANFTLIEKNGETYIACGEELLLPVEALPMRGRHQHANVLASLAIGSVCGFDREAMLTTAVNFHGLPHRCQLVTNHDNVLWYNDSKATNVGAAAAALNGIGVDIPGKVIWLAGGQGKDADFSPLRSAVSEHVRTAILFGQDKDKIAEAIGNVVPVVHVKDLEDAVQKAHSLAHSGDAVLLAPACASFDMFDNFEHRGQRFVEIVKEILR